MTLRQQADPTDLLTRLLSRVSRSFYLTLRVLPAQVRRPIGLAYLLARTTDTIADSELVPAPERLAALARLRDSISGRHVPPPTLADLAQSQTLPAERELLSRVGEALHLLNCMTPDDASDIREVLAVITSGQELDLRRFGCPEPGQVLALQSDEDLDDYTWRVAGCVGRFWTRVCRRNLFPRALLDDEALIRDGIRFGKGLQLINILRDLAHDLRQGRCYLPEYRLHQAGLKPADLLAPSAEARLRPVFDPLIALAESHLAAGWRYTNTLPPSQRRVRLACAWPILIGAATLSRLKTTPVLNPNQRVKVSRLQVYQILLRSLWRLPRPAAWARQFGESVMTFPQPGPSSRT
jgi:farnesyl-diphosphate farnesyltransferase